jgi:hypothetical protein
VFIFLLSIKNLRRNNLTNNHSSPKPNPNKYKNFHSNPLNPENPDHPENPENPENPDHPAHPAHPDNPDHPDL